MSKKGLPSLLDRHWGESVLAIGAVIIAAVSLWVAYDTERTNRQLVTSERDLVAASSWPFVQIAENDQTPDGKPGMTLFISNGGIGPAKLETFEVFWKGKAQRNPWELLGACCVPPGASSASTAAGPDLPFGRSTTSGVVLRAGQVLNFLFLERTAEDAASLDALGSRLSELSFRYCYCSAFDECWLSEQHFGRPHDMNPPRVRVCPEPAVPYTNHRS